VLKGFIVAHRPVLLPWDVLGWRLRYREAFALLVTAIMPTQDSWVLTLLLIPSLATCKILGLSIH
jgi:hypothetical protein